MEVNKIFEPIFKEINSRLQFDQFDGQMATQWIQIATRKWQAFAEALTIKNKQALRIADFNSGALLEIYIAIAHPDLPFIALILWNSSPLGDRNGLHNIMLMNRNKG